MSERRYNNVVKEYTENAQKALETAEFLALMNGNVIDSAILLAAIIKTEKSSASIFLYKYGLTEDKIDIFLTKKSKIETKIILITDTTKKILSITENKSMENKVPISTISLLYSISMCSNCSAAKILNKFQITTDKILDYISFIPKQIAFSNKSKKNFSPEKSSEIKKELIHKQAIDPEMLKYGKNLLELAEKSELPTIIAREKELDQLIRILSKSQKNNAMIIGESGVGKTSLVYLLAQKIAEKKVPDILSQKMILDININSLVSGTKYRGELEEKITDLISLAEKNNVILFIDDIHSISTIGNTENGANPGEIIKLFSDNKKISIIGTTTYVDYAKYFEKNHSFDRRFVKLHVQEPSEQDTIVILNKIKSKYEEHYQIKIDKKVIPQTIRLVIRYLPNKKLPYKAIDLIDDACSKVVLNNRKRVTENDLKCILTEITGIPLENLEEERTKYLDLRLKMGKKIIGQDEALDAVSECLIRAKSGIRNSNRPIGSFLFLGSTGVGKTETAKALAEILFGSQDMLVRFDMSEYADKNSVTKLIGAPPGYIGYDEGGNLTEKIKNKPFSIILFDEIEKADLDIYDILLQVLDDGRLTDSKGITVDFRNTIIIMTSNIGNTVTRKTQIGFVDIKVDESEKEMRLECLKKTMRPEFLNRIDSIISFKKLDKENLSKIADNIIEEKKKNLFLERGIVLNVLPSLKKEIAEQSYTTEYGARPIRRTIEKLLDNELGKRILQENIINTEISVGFKNKKTVITVKQ